MKIFNSVIYGNSLSGKWIKIYRFFVIPIFFVNLRKQDKKKKTEAQASKKAVITEGG